MKNYCKNLNNNITFHHKGITFCTSLWTKEESYILYDSKCIENFIEKRNYWLKEMEAGENIDYCKNCMYLKEIDDSVQINNKITHIDIYHWINCNCACYYCTNRYDSKLRITKEKVNGQISILKCLKKLKKLNLLDDNLSLSTHGGEPTILKEFGDIIKFALKNKYPMTLLSNGILYEKNIPKILGRLPESYLTISLDSGTRETYKKIKRVDKFDDVVNNVKRYIKEIGEEFSFHLIMKYIILKDMNDNKEEIDKWIDVCTSIGVRNFFPSIEFIDGVNHPERNTITPKIVELYNYIKKRVKEINPNFMLSQYDFVEERILKFQTYGIRQNNLCENSWGTSKIIAEGKGYMIKIITINPHQEFNIQNQDNVRKYWLVFKGIANVVKNDKEITLQESDIIDSSGQETSTIQNHEETALIIMEVVKDNIFE